MTTPYSLLVKDLMESPLFSKNREFTGIARKAQAAPTAAQIKAVRDAATAVGGDVGDLIDTLWDPSTPALADPSAMSAHLNSVSASNAYMVAAQCWLAMNLAGLSTNQATSKILAPVMAKIGKWADPAETDWISDWYRQALMKLGWKASDVPTVLQVGHGALGKAFISSNSILAQLSKIQAEAAKADPSFVPGPAPAPAPPAPAPAPPAPAPAPAPAPGSPAPGSNPLRTLIETAVQSGVRKARTGRLSAISGYLPATSRQSDVEAKCDKAMEKFIDEETAGGRAESPAVYEGFAEVAFLALFLAIGNVGDINGKRDFNNLVKDMDNILPKWRNGYDAFSAVKRALGFYAGHAITGEKAADIFGLLLPETVNRINTAINSPSMATRPDRAAYQALTVGDTMANPQKVGKMCGSPSGINQGYFMHADNIIERLGKMTPADAVTNIIRVCEDSANMAATGVWPAGVDHRNVKSPADLAGIKSPGAGATPPPLPAAREVWLNIGTISMASAVLYTLYRIYYLEQAGVGRHR